MTASTSSMVEIHLTEAAKTYLLSCFKTHPKCLGMRLSLKKTGCSGLSYVVDYIEEPMPEDYVLPFIAPYHIYIEKRAYPFLQGMTIDYVKAQFGSELVFKNPNEKGQCGCGESFTVE